MIDALMSERIDSLFFLYLYVESVFSLFLAFLGICLRKIVRVGRWSVMVVRWCLQWCEFL